MEPNEQAHGYSTVTGLIYVFNLIIGTGALALPGAVAKAGVITGSLLLVVLGLASFITVTFIIETLAVANAVSSRNLQVQFEETDEAENRRLLEEEEESNCYEIEKKLEVTELAAALLSRPARIIVVTCLILYLLGDLSIYCAVIARTLSHTICIQPTNLPCNDTVPDTELCWEGFHLTRRGAYQILVGVVVACLGPFVFMNLQKTKWLQMLTSAMRWAAFSIMIVWSVIKLSTNGKQGSPPLANIDAVPTLFGTCVYSFMCQHSIPGLIQPIRDKLSFKNTLPFNYAITAFFYLLLTLTAVYTFSHVEDIYTLNFWSDTCSSSTSSSVLFLDYYLALFPVFTLSTSFPIIAITLRSNLEEVLVSGDRHTVPTWQRICLPLLTLVIPATLALAVPNLQMLVGVVGSYGGAALQYLAPALLVSAARARQAEGVVNPYASPFKSHFWVVAIYMWTVVCVTLISVNYALMILQ